MENKEKTCCLAVPLVPCIPDGPQGSKASGLAGAENRTTDYPACSWSATSHTLAVGLFSGNCDPVTPLLLSFGFMAMMWRPVPGAAALPHGVPRPPQAPSPCPSDSPQPLGPGLISFRWHPGGTWENNWTSGRFIGSTLGRHGWEETEESRTGLREKVTHSEVTPDKSAGPTGSPKPKFRQGSPSCPLTQPVIAHEGPLAADVALGDTGPCSWGHLRCGDTFLRHQQLKFPGCFDPEEKVGVSDVASNTCHSCNPQFTCLLEQVLPGNSSIKWSLGTCKGRRGQ